uniref:Uncharacterized protein n=1 Tax=Rhizophora mucronata TaxID=61149 RepID=A0A2P2PK92_RHIMU
MYNIDPTASMQEIHVNVHHASAYCMHIEKEDQKLWYHDIKYCLKTKKYPKRAIKNDKRTLRRLVMNFFLSGDILYK